MRALLTRGGEGESCRGGGQLTHRTRTGSGRLHQVPVCSLSVCVREAAVGHLGLRRAPQRRGGRIMHVEIHPLLGRQGSAPPPGAARHKKMMRGGRCNEAPAPSLHGGLIDAGEESEERPQVEGEEVGMGEEEPWEWERHGGEGGGEDG